MARFEKGISGNPGGRPKEVGDLRILARERTGKALDTLSEVMEDTKAPAAARVAAALALLDRGHGKPMQQTQFSVADAQLEEKFVDPAIAARKWCFIAALALKNAEAEKAVKVTS